MTQAVWGAGGSPQKQHSCPENRYLWSCHSHGRIDVRRNARAGSCFFFFFKAGVSLLQLLNVSFKDEYKTATLPSKS